MLVTNASASRSPARTRALALAALSLSVLVVGLDTTVLNVALPSISVDLGADTADLQWVVDTYLLAVVAVMLPAGALGDRWGHKRVLLGGLIVFGAASVCSALAGSIQALIAARVLQGIGAAVLVPLGLAIVTTTFTPDQRAKAIGVLTAAVAAGLPLGPILSGVLLARWSWASVFWVNVPIVAVALVAGWLLLPAVGGDRTVRLDWLGTLTSTAGLVALVYAIVRAPTAGWASPSTLGLIGAAVVLLAAFVLTQRRAHHLIDLTLFTNPRFTGGSLAVAAASAVLLTVLFVLPQYLQGVRAASAAGTGLRILPLMLGLVVAGSASSAAQQRWGTGKTVTAALLVVAAGTAVLSLARPVTAYPLLAAALVLTGAGIGAAVAPAMDAATSTVPHAAAASGSALINTVRQLSAALAVAGLGSVLAAVYRTQLTPAATDLPADTQAQVLGSLAGAASSGLSGPAAQTLRQGAASAFTTGMSTVMLTCTAFSIGCALITRRLLRDRPQPVDGPAQPPTRRQPSHRIKDEVLKHD